MSPETFWIAAGVVWSIYAFITEREARSHRREAKGFHETVLSDIGEIKGSQQTLVKEFQDVKTLQAVHSEKIQNLEKGKFTKRTSKSSKLANGHF